MIDLMQLWHFLFVLGICLTRLVVCFSLLPFTGGNLLPGYVKNGFMLTMVLVTYPTVAAGAPEEVEMIQWVLILLKEAFVGLLLGFVTATIFWAMEIAGFLIDNQRGSSMASVFDPLYGHNTSVLGSLLLQFTTVVFFSIGGFLFFMDGLFKSYEFWPVFQLLPGIEGHFAVFFLQKLDGLMRSALLLASPFLIVTVLTDLCLGLMSRFVPQMNVFFLSMPVKSGIASFLLVVFLWVLLHFARGSIENATNLMESLRGVVHGQ